MKFKIKKPYSEINNNYKIFCEKSVLTFIYNVCIIK